MNRSLLDEPADIHAEIGSKPWARGLARAVRCNAEKLDSDVQHMQGFIRIAAEHNAWKVLGYISLDAFLIAEANFTESIIEAIRSAKPGTKIGEITSKDKIREEKIKHPELTQTEIAKKVGVTKGYVSQVFSEKLQCNNLVNMPDHIKTRPHKADFRKLPAELQAKVASKEMSLNAAAIAAGIRKKPSPEETIVKAFSKAQDRLQVAKSILLSLSREDAAALIEWFSQQDA